MPLPNYTPCIDANADELIIKYFDQGYAYEVIKEFLRCRHNVLISLSTIERRLRKYECLKRPLIARRSSIQDLTRAIEDQLSGSGSVLGYRKIHANITANGLIAKKDDVRLILKQLDPNGVEARRKKRLRRRRFFSPGPNHCWCIDGHDKLKPYGFSIHGCICAFSRRILWLEVSSSNKLPEVIAEYYLNTVSQLKCIPHKITADDGTEHALIQPMQIYLRSLNGDGNELDSFSIIPSPRNQRIEAYWSHLRRDRPAWWQIFFDAIESQGLFDGNDPALVDCIRFCFMHLLREELNDVAIKWNQHAISESRRNTGPTGKPDCMYFLPHLYDADDYAKMVDMHEVEELKTVTGLPPDVSPEFKEFAEIIMSENNMTIPDNINDALNLYYFLHSEIINNS